MTALTLDYLRAQEQARANAANESLKMQDLARQQRALDQDRALREAALDIQDREVSIKEALQDDQLLKLREEIRKLAADTDLAISKQKTDEYTRLDNLASSGFTSARSALADLLYSDYDVRMTEKAADSVLTRLSKGIETALPFVKLFS